MTVSAVNNGWLFVCSEKLREGSTVNCLFRSAVYGTKKEAEKRQKDHEQEHKQEKKK